MPAIATSNNEGNYYHRDIRHLRKRKDNPSPNLSPTRGEALKPHFPRREGGRGGLGLCIICGI